MKRSSNFFRHILWAVATLIVAAGLYSLVFHPQSPTQHISLNELAAKINADEVSAITVQSDTLTVQLKNGGTVQVEKESDASLTETLKNLNVSSENLQRVSITISNNSGWRFWAGIILPSVLPVLLIAAVLWFV